MSNAFPNESTQSPLSRCPITLTTAKTLGALFTPTAAAVELAPDLIGAGAPLVVIRNVHSDLPGTGSERLAAWLSSAPHASAVATICWGSLPRSSHLLLL